MIKTINKIKKNGEEMGDCLDRIDSLIDKIITANRKLERAEKARDKCMKFINGMEV